MDRPLPPLETPPFDFFHDSEITHQGPLFREAPKPPVFILPLSCTKKRVGHFFPGSPPFLAIVARSLSRRMTDPPFPVGPGRLFAFVSKKQGPFFSFLDEAVLIGHRLLPPPSFFFLFSWNWTVLPRIIVP